MTITNSCYSASLDGALFVNKEKGEANGFERKLKKKVLVCTDFKKNILLWSGTQDAISSTLTMTIKLPKMCRPIQCVFFL